MKTNLKKKIMLALLAGGMMYAGTAAAFNLNLAAQTAATGNTYSTGGISKTVVRQETKNGDITLGQTINFGNYQQSIATGSLIRKSLETNHDAIYKENGTVTYNTENVNWIVLKQDGNKYTLVSTKLLDQHKFHDSNTTNKWSESGIRTWMNNEMLNTMFTTDRERNLLQSQDTVTYGYTSGDKGKDGWDDSTSTDASKGYNTATGDKLWLLSVQELHEYFQNDVDTDPTRAAYSGGGTASGKVPWGAGVTDFAKSKGVCEQTDGGVTAVDGSLNAYYLLRSPSSQSAYSVRRPYSYGMVNNHDATNTANGVRPAMIADFSNLLFTSVGGERDANGKVTIKGKYMGAGSYNTSDGKHEFVKEAGGNAAKFEAMTANSNLDLTFYDADVSQNGLTANTTLELGADSLFKLGYTGANSSYDIAGMIATVNATSGYTPVGWGKMAFAGSTSGTMGIGFNNIDAGEYSLHIMGEEGTGTSFVGDVVITFDGLKKTADGLELDLTTIGNTDKTFSGAVTVEAGNKLTANANQLTGTDAITDNGTMIFTGGTLVRTVSGTGNLTFSGDVTTDASNIATTGTNTVESDKTVTFTGGTLTGKMEGAGNLTFDGDVNASADNVAVTGTIKVNSGKKWIVTEGNINKTVENNGTVLLQNGATLNGAYITSGTLEIDGGETSEIDADYILADTTLIDSGANLTVKDGTLTKTITGAGNLKFTGDVTTNADNIATTGTNTVESDKTLTFTGGTLTKKVEGAGNLKFTEDVTTNADNIATTGTNTVDSDKTVTFTGGTLTKKMEGAGNLKFTGDVTTDASNVATTGTNTVESDKTVTFTGGTLTKKMEGAGNLKFTGDVTTNADNVATTGTNTVESDKTVTFTGGTLTKKMEGAGNLKFTGDVTTNADNIATTGTNTVESGTTTFTGGTLEKNITGAGTAEFNNTVSVADGVNLGTATNNVNGTLDVAGNVTASNINFKSGSTLKVDGSKITSTAAIRGLTSATVESGSKLFVANAEKDTEYKILAGSGISVSGWQTDDDMADEFKASYGLKVDTENITNNGTEFNIKFKEDTQATGSSDIGNIVANLPADSGAKAWVDEISSSQSDTATQGNTVNTMANMAQLANVQTGTCVINNLATENIWDNRDIMARPLLVRGQRLAVRNVAAKTKDNAKIETVEQGQASGIMPEQQKEQVYSKEIWASYIHSKQKVDGMETGHLRQNSNIQYNGVTVGTDLWSGRHGFGGVALTYADGNVNSTQKVSQVKNDVDYYGLTVYNRQDVDKFSFQYDGGITHSKNDVTMSTQGAEDVTARPKVNIYNIGGRVENSYKLSEKAEVVPFAGLRYIFVKTKEYHNSLGMGFDVDNQHMWNVPVGVAFRSNFGDVDGWQMGSTLEAGYAWNLGDRDSEQRITYGNTYDVVGFNTADKGQYFVKGALQAKRKNLTAEVGYRYSKGDTVRDSRWNFNVGVSF